MSRRSALTRTILSARRAKDILSVLIRYGFADVVQEIGLDRVVFEGMRRLHLRSDDSYDPLPQAVRLRKALEELGPTFVKLGQILSLRPDLIPTEWAEEFRKLQDDVAPVPYDDIQKQLESEFPDGLDKIFSKISPEPLAAGSMAQVHRAELVSGDKVVIKVLRPNVEEITSSDVEILSLLADFAEDHFSNLGYSPTEVVQEFSKELSREMDLSREARNTERFTQAFVDMPQIRFPHIYREASTRRVMTMEEIKGTRLSDLDPDEAPKELRMKFVRNAADAVFKQCLVDGFFHADPHPGNLFVLDDGEIAFIDCGMTGHIESNTVEKLASLVQGAIHGDLDQVIDATLTMVHGDPRLAESRRFRADVLELIERFESAKLADIQMGAFLEEFFTRIREHKLQCPGNIVFLLKALATIESVGERYAPEFEVMRHIRPYVDQLVKRQFGYRAIRRRVMRTVVDYAGLLERFPRHVASVIWEVRRNSLRITLEHQGLDQVTNEIEKASGNLSHAILVASLILGSAMLLLAAQVGEAKADWLTMLALIGFVSAVVMVVWRSIGNWFR